MSEISLDKYTWNGVAQLFYCCDKGGSKFIFVLFQIIYLRFVFYSAQILWHSCLPSSVMYVYIVYEIEEKEEKKMIRDRIKWTTEDKNETKKNIMRKTG